MGKAIDNNGKVDVSVIVPVYNTEKYLPQCIESLQKQTLKTVEFIFVDDGSTDSSVQIIEQYATSDKKIKLIRQSNQYAGVARNNGLKEAVGKYVVFLDSDDFFKKDLLKKTFRCAEKNNAEIVLFGFRLYNEKTKKVGWKRLVPRVKKGVFSIDNYDNLFNLSYTGPWNKIYLRSFLVENDIKFPPIQRSEDVFFVCLGLSLAKRISLLNKTFVYYRIGNTNSLEGNFNKNVKCIVDSKIELKKEFLKRNIFEGNIKKSFFNMCYDRRVLGISELKSHKEYYEYLKQNLMPGIFDSEEEFANDEIVKKIFECENYEAFLFSLLRIEIKAMENKANYNLLSIAKYCLNRICGFFKINKNR